MTDELSDLGWAVDTRWRDEATRLLKAKHEAEKRIEELETALRRVLAIPIHGSLRDSNAHWDARRLLLDAEAKP